MIVSNSLRFITALTDLLVISFFVTVFLPVIEGFVDLHSSGLDLNYFFVSLSSWTISAAFFGVYDHFSIGNFELLLRRTFRSFLLYILVLGWVLFFIFHTSISRNFVISIVAITFVALCFSRLAHFLVMRHYRITQKQAIRFAVLGDADSVVDFVNYLETKPQFYKFLGVIKLGILRNSKSFQELAILGGSEDLVEICKKNEISEIFCFGFPDENPELLKLYKNADLNFIRMRFVPNFRGGLQHMTQVDFMGPFPVLSLRIEPLEHKFNQIKKRVFDIVFSILVILFLFSWLFPILAILIKLTSKGPVFFVQERTGKNNLTFRCIKFRSMAVNLDADKLQATANDFRLTRFGSFLRKSNLDELPQFFNVLKGDMSVVGPRPHMLKHTEQYSELIEKYMIRHWLKPGITGWAQINGLRGETKELIDMHKRVEHDIWYGENWNFYLDLKIVILTIWNAFKGDPKAY